MKKLFLLISLFVFISVSSLWAQTRVITGTVTSSVQAEGPIPGVTVQVKGTTIGAVTDINGKYSINAPEGATTLLFSYIGMKAVEVAIDGRSVINGVMESDILGLDEVVVTALGITREKKALGYAVQQVSGEELNKVRETNFASSLSGKIAGVQVKQANTMGGSVNVNVRGVNSLTGNNQPLFVIDGVPVDNSNTNSSTQTRGGGGYDYGNAASDLSPDDIESLSVLKGAAAAALYGSRAANGVILITTKKGAARKGLGVTINSGVMVSKIDKSSTAKLQNQYGAGYGPFYGPDEDAYFNEADIDGDGDVELIVPTFEDASWGAKFDPSIKVVQWDAMDPSYPNFGEATPWIAPKANYLSFFETGVKYTNNIAIDGGNEDGTFRVSYTNVDEKGILPNSSNKRNTINFTGSYKLTSKFTAEANANFVNNRTIGRYGTGYDGFNPMQSMLQWFQTNVDFEKMKDYETPDGRQRAWNYVNYNDLRAYFSDNPYWIRYKNFSNDGRDRVFGYTKLNYMVSDWLNITARFSDDYYHEFREERIAINSAVAGNLPYYSKNQRAFNEFNTELFLNFNKTFNKISVTGLLGGSTRTNSVFRTYGTTTGGLAIPDFYSLTNTIAPVSITENDEKERVNSAFGNLNLGWNRLFYLDFTARVDQSSTLPEDNNTYFYPSVSGSVILTEIPAIKNLAFLSFAKLRVNYAEVGNDADVYSTKMIYDQGVNWGNFAMFSAAGRMLNPELKPEATHSYEAGLEASFFENRLGFDVSYYKKNTLDQIMPVTISTASGYSSIFINGGEIENKGIELALNAVPVKLSGFEWNFGLNWFSNKNKVVDLYEDIDNYLLFSAWDVSVNARVGESYGNIEGTNFVYTNGKKTVGTDGYYLRSPGNETIGNINPDWNMGVINNLSYKNVGLRFLVDIQKGGDIYSVNTKYGRSTGLYAETAGLNELGVEKRTPLSENPNGGILFDAVLVDGSPNTKRVEAFRWGRAWDYNKLPTAEYVFDASYVKLREVALTYELPKSLISKTPLNRVTISAVGRNLWIIHKNTEHFDPEAALSAGNLQGIESGSYPSTRNFGFDISIGF